MNSTDDRRCEGCPVDQEVDRFVDFSSYIEGCWYWVTDGHFTWIAKRDELSAGGWTNEDTWEDFNGDVTGAELIQLASWERE